MSSDEITKENIKVETEIFKIFVFIVIVLTGGVYGLLIQITQGIMNALLFGGGLVLLIFFTFVAVSKYISIKKTIKKFTGKQKQPCLKLFK